MEGRHKRPEVCHVTNLHTSYGFISEGGDFFFGELRHDKLVSNNVEIRVHLYQEETRTSPFTSPSLFVPTACKRG